MYSPNLNDYDILIRRRGPDDYASYCPQLMHLIVGTEHEEVENAMKDYIEHYVESKAITPDTST